MYESTRVARSWSLCFHSCRHVAWSLAEASRGVNFLKRGRSITCRVTVRWRRSPLEQDGLEVLCELAFSGTEKLTKNVRVHVRTITLGGRLPGCQHMLQGRKGRGERLRLQIARNGKKWGWALGAYPAEYGTYLFASNTAFTLAWNSRLTWAARHGTNFLAECKRLLGRAELCHGALAQHGLSNSADTPRCSSALQEPTSVNKSSKKASGDISETFSEL